jgi:hypothetical protein
MTLLFGGVNLRKENICIDFFFIVPVCLCNQSADSGNVCLKWLVHPPINSVFGPRGEAWKHLQSPRFTKEDTPIIPWKKNAKVTFRSTIPTFAKIYTGYTRWSASRVHSIWRVILCYGVPFRGTLAYNV